MATMTETLKKAILAYESRYRLSIDSGVDAGALCRFVGGQATLTLDSIERLAGPLGLRLVADKRETTNRDATRSSKRSARKGAED